MVFKQCKDCEHFIYNSVEEVMMCELDKCSYMEE